MLPGISMPDDRLSEGKGNAPLNTPCVPVLVNITLSDTYLDQIASVDPRIEVLRAYKQPDDDARARGDEGSAIEGEALMEMVRRAVVIFSFRFPIEWLDSAPDLEWVQLASAGSDHMLGQGLLD